MTPRLPPESALPADAEIFRGRILAWYQRHARPLPWREGYEDGPNPYQVWLSEVMLQQTTVAAVIPYYRRFLEKYPTVQALAAAPIDDILHLWQGLGYYRRAHLLHATAKAVTETHAGTFPATEARLLELPGFGPYTAAAVAAIAFDQPATVVDGNVERVVSRLFRVQTPLPAAKPELRKLAATLADPAHPRLYANAVMELGATVCTPRSPLCPACPVNAHCAAFRHGDQLTYPRKTPKKPLPTKTATAYVVTDGAGRLYLRKRPAKGLLGGLWEIPHQGPWENAALPAWSLSEQDVAGQITHTFTHFHLVLDVVTARSDTPHPAANAFAAEALPPIPTLMRKVLKTAKAL